MFWWLPLKAELVCSCTCFFLLQRKSARWNSPWETRKTVSHLLYINLNNISKQYGFVVRCFFDGSVCLAVTCCNTTTCAGQKFFLICKHKRLPVLKWENFVRTLELYLQAHSIYNFLTFTDIFNKISLQPNIST